MEKPLFLKPVAAAALIGASKSKIYEMIQKGEIPSCRIGSLLRVPREAIERLASEAMKPTGDKV